MLEWYRHAVRRRMPPQCHYARRQLGRPHRPLADPRPAVAYRRVCAGRGAATYNIGAWDYGIMRQTLQALCDHAGTRADVRSAPSRWTAPAMKVVSRTGLQGPSRHPLARQGVLRVGKRVLGTFLGARVGGAC